MTTKKPKLAILFIVGVMTLSVIAISCNNSNDEKKEEPSMEKKEAAPDTTKMDTATTRPVKNPI